MTPLALTVLVQLASAWAFAGGSDAAYGLPELTKDILERIKAATGQPIDTERFMPIVAASLKSYEVLEPLGKRRQYLRRSRKRKVDGGWKGGLSGKEGSSGLEKGKFLEILEREKDGNELLRYEYGDEVGRRQEYSEEKQYRKDRDGSVGGKKGGKSRKGRRRGKFHMEKGFRDVYHKDEEKKSEFFWNNEHEEGKWIEYGLKKRKQEKSRDKGEEGKREKDEAEESSYERKEKKKS